MTTLTPDTEQRTDGLWALHDIAIGAICGFAIGLVTGMFASVRIHDSGWFMWTTALIGAIGVPALLIRWHGRNPERPGWPAITTWVLGAMAYLFIAGLIWALSNFE